MIKLAICVRGSLRTWDFCKHNIFNTFNFAGHNVSVDWFFDTWDEDTFVKKTVTVDKKLVSETPVRRILDLNDVEKIKKDFAEHRQRLISVNLHRFESEMNPAESFLKLIFLSNMSKRMHELSNNMRYDIVLQIRPDTIYFTNPADFREIILSSAKFNAVNYSKRSYNAFGDFQGYCTLPDAPSSPFTSVEGIAPVPDFIFYGPSWAIDYLSSCWVAINESNKVKRFFPHATLYLHLRRANIVVANETETVHIIRNMEVVGVGTYDQFLANPDSAINITKDLLDWIDLSNGAWYVAR